MEVTATGLEDHARQVDRDVLDLEPATAAAVELVGPYDAGLAGVNLERLVLAVQLGFPGTYPDDFERVVQVRRGGKILVSATRRSLAPDVGAVVQVQAECAK